MSKRRLSVFVWVACDPNSGLLGVYMTRAAALCRLRAHWENARIAIRMRKLAGTLPPGKMPPSGKVVKLELPGAGYDALYPRKPKP